MRGGSALSAGVSSRLVGACDGVSVQHRIGRIRHCRLGRGHLAVPGQGQCPATRVRQYGQPGHSDRRQVPRLDHHRYGQAELDLSQRGGTEGDQPTGAVRNLAHDQIWEGLNGASPITEGDVNSGADGWNRMAQTIETGYEAFNKAVGSVVGDS